MPLNSDYYERILDAVESSETAYNNGDIEEAASYMEEVKMIASDFLEEVEEMENFLENDEEG